jgi:putative hydrolase of HD superfamily
MKKNISLKPYANFLFEAGILAKTPRSGFRHLDGWDQSIAEHLCRTAYVGLVLAHMEQEKGVQLDSGKVIERCLFHDFGEARASDLDYVSQKYTTTDELRAIQDAVKELPFGDRIINAFKETESRSTPEGNVAKDADQIEFICCLKEIIDSGNTQAEPWIKPVLQRLKTSSAQELAKEILATDSNEWWFSKKDDQHWVVGGKTAPSKKE